MAHHIHSLWVGLSCLLIVLFCKGAHSASVKARQTLEEEHNFDLGPLRCCRHRDSDVCPDIGEYIPCPFVKDMDSREETIRMRMMNYENVGSQYENCSRDLGEVLCEQNFPTCVINADGSHSVEFPAQDTCEQRMESCPNFVRQIAIFQDICSLYEPESTTYSVSNCTVPEITLTHCNVDWYLPEWGYQYLQQIDLELDNMRKDELRGLSDTCWQKVTDFQCRSVGRCWAQGYRLEHINSINTCHDLVSSCISSGLQRGYEQLVFGCGSLPDEQNRPLTEPTAITLTPPTRETMTPSPEENTTKPTLSTDSDQFTAGSASISSASLPFILLTLAISLLLVR